MKRIEIVEKGEGHKKDKELQCSGKDGNTLTRVCTDEKCSKGGGTCIKLECSCWDVHQNCIRYISYNCVQSLKQEYNQVNSDFQKKVLSTLKNLIKKLAALHNAILQKEHELVVPPPALRAIGSSIDRKTAQKLDKFLQFAPQKGVKDYLKNSKIWAELTDGFREQAKKISEAIEHFETDLNTMIRQKKELLEKELIAQKQPPPRVQRVDEAGFMREMEPNNSRQSSPSKQQPKQG